MEKILTTKEESSFSDVLKNIQFLLLWLSQTFSQFGDRIFLLFMVDLVTKAQFSNSEVSKLILIYTIPAIIFGSFAGVFVDRWNKKLTMILCNILRAICVLLLFISDSNLNIYIITFLVSTFTQFFAPAEASSIPELVEKKNLLPANSLFMGTMFSSVVFGFAIGTPIINKFSHQITTLAIFGMYFVAALLLLFLKNIQVVKKESKHFFDEFIDGYNYVISHKIVLFCVVRQIIVFSAFAALSVLAIGFVNDVLHLKPVFFGYMLAIAGLGMGLGAVVSGRFGNRVGKDFLIFSGFIISSIMLISLALTNHIAWGMGLEKKEQQKELYTSLSILNDYGKNKNVIEKINAVFIPKPNGVQSISSRNKIESFSINQINNLAELLDVEKDKLELLKKDEKTQKTNLAKLINNISREEDIFVMSDSRNIKLSKKANVSANNSNALKFFIKMQNTYIVADLLKNITLEDHILNSIMVLTDNNIENLKNLRNFLKLDEDGISTIKPEQLISEMPQQHLLYLSNIFETENEDFTFDDVQGLKISEYLDKIILNEPSKLILNKAKAIKSIINDPSNPIIKLLIKQESSYFEVFLAFFITLIVGFGSALSAIPLQTILQEVVDEKFRGKVFGVQNMAISLSMSIPMGISGFLADALDGKIFNMNGVSIVMIITALFILFGGFIENTFKQKKSL
ncbi:MAG: MFS transporter [Cyanobacteriota bacterium]